MNLDGLESDSFDEWVVMQPNVKWVDSRAFYLTYSLVPCFANIITLPDKIELEIRPVHAGDNIGAGSGKPVYGSFLRNILNEKENNMSKDNFQWTDELVASNCSSSRMFCAAMIIFFCFLTLIIEVF